MCATLAGTPSLSPLRKSITRYCRLWPPPLWRVVMRPYTLRPAFFGSGRSSDFSGSLRVISAKSETLAPRRPGVVGLYLRMAIVGSRLSFPSASAAAEQRDLVAGADGHDRPLGVVAPAVPGAGALALALPVEGVHGDDLHLRERLLDRVLDLELAGRRLHDERVLVLLEERVALLGDHRLEQDVMPVVQLAGA